MVDSSGCKKITLEQNAVMIDIFLHNIPFGSKKTVESLNCQTYQSYSKLGRKTVQIQLLNELPNNYTQGIFIKLRWTMVVAEYVTNL